MGKFFKLENLTAYPSILDTFSGGLLIFLQTSMYSSQVAGALVIPCCANISFLYFPVFTRTENSPILFRAHGTINSLWQEAHDKKMNIIDATCPLVYEIHHEVKKLAQDGRQIFDKKNQGNAFAWTQFLR